ncbi:MAG: right-handed parallel beta-helix repeat-containing protein [Planctomycetota bacterium]|nr:MAG: right-handed parallel beta-helix repeat-containing protein [Planctomycetota bacterium]
MKHTLSFARMVSLSKATLALLPLLSASSIAQTEVWVDMTAGSNFNDGSMGSPWSTVDFALNGIHAPLPQGTVIRIVGQDPGVKYSPASGDAFPWVIYNNVSLVAEESPGKTVVVDTTTGVAVEFNPSSECTSSRIEGLSFECVNGPIVEVAPSSGVTHAPTFENCEFANQSGTGLKVMGGTLGTIAPTFEQCSVSSGSYAVHLNYGSASYAATKIRNCTLEGGASTSHATILTDGSATSGVSEISGSSLVAHGTGIYLNLNAAISIVGNTITKQGSQNYEGIYIRPNSNWIDYPLRDNDVDGFYNGYYIYDADNVTVSGGSLSNNRYGIRNHFVVDNLSILGCTIASGDTGMWASPSYTCNGLRIEDCTFQDLTDGIYSSSNRFPNARIVRNLFLRNCNGIELSNATGWVVQGNRFEDSTCDAIYLNGSTPCSFIGNEIINCAQGITVNDASGLILSSNIIAGCNGVGVNLLGPASPVTTPKIENNTIANCSSYGLQTALDSTVEPYVGNTIFWGNNGIGNEFIGLAFGQYHSCVMEDGGSPGNGNSATDPELTVDYRLEASSWCRDAGDPAWSNSWIDVDGDPRHVDNDWDGVPFADRGADEANATSLSLAGLLPSERAVLPM